MLRAGSNELNDEKRLCMHTTNGCLSVRRKTKERHLPECNRSQQIGPTAGITVKIPGYFLHYRKYVVQLCTPEHYPTRSATILITEK